MTRSHHRFPQLFAQNEAWAKSMVERDATFFSRLSSQQDPDFLWIGCSDSRVPATEICGMEPGEMFVHRNVANLVVHTDFNLLAVLQFAVDVLQVNDIIVCGHYGCGGVKAAMSSERHGLIDNWLRNIKDVYAKHYVELSALDEAARLDRLCELNVEGQVANLAHSTIVQDAWRRGADLTIHGLIYRLTDGVLRDLDLCVATLEELPEAYRMR